MWGNPARSGWWPMLKDPDAEEEAKMLAIGLLRDLESTQPKMLYIQWQMDRAEKDEMRDYALESLKEMGESVIQPILQEFAHANPAGQEALMDVLAQYPGHEQIFRIGLRLFQERPEKRALFAGYLAKIGDDRALPALIEAAKDPEVNYLTFIELRSAIEELGGTCPDREYEDDPEYEALRGLD